MEELSIWLREKRRRCVVYAYARLNVRLKKKKKENNFATIKCHWRVTVAFGIAVPRIFQYYNHSLLYNSKYNILDSVFHSLFLYSAIALQHTRRGMLEPTINIIFFSSLPAIRILPLRTLTRAWLKLKNQLNTRQLNSIQFTRTQTQWKPLGMIGQKKV